MKYSLPPLPYAYDALEPHIDAKTMEIHHSKHHQAYISNLNTVLEKYPQIAGKKLEELMENIENSHSKLKTKQCFKTTAVDISTILFSGQLWDQKKKLMIF